MAKNTLPSNDLMQFASELVTKTIQSAAKKVEDESKKHTSHNKSNKTDKIKIIFTYEPNGTESNSNKK